MPHIHVMSHVVHYGSSVFEGVRCYALPERRRQFSARRNTCSGCSIPPKSTALTWTTASTNWSQPWSIVIKTNGVWPCYIRPIVLRGYGEAGVNPFNCPIEVYIANYPWGKYLGTDRARAWMSAFLPGRGCSQHAAGDGEGGRELHELAADQDGSHRQRLRRGHCAGR